jgi:hypothetical protein
MIRSKEAADKKPIPAKKAQKTAPAQNFFHRAFFAYAK